MAEQILLLVASTTQTGDIPHIAGALALCSTVDALITHDTGEDTALLEKLYQSAASSAPSSRAGRVGFLPVPPSQKQGVIPQKNLYHALKDCENLLSPTDSQSKVFKEALGQDGYTAFKNKYLIPNAKNVAKFKIMSLTQATGAIAKAYKVDKLGSYSLISHGVVYDPPIQDIISKDGKFGNIPLPAADKPILLLWARYTGTKTENGFNPEGDSDPTGQNQIVKTATDSGFTVVSIGDTPSSGTDNAPYHLGEFWKQEKLSGEGRAAQCSFFVALMEHYPGMIYQMGQKTGAMDFPALLGIPTIYIEDSGIPSAAKSRMQQWTDPSTLQLYRRLEVEEPPSIPGKGARRWAETFGDEQKASANRKRVGEAAWRMAGQLHSFRGLWKAITNIEKEPKGNDGIADVVAHATAEQMKTWNTNISLLPDAECEKAHCIRGYTAKDLADVKTALSDLRKEYNASTMIIRKAGGTYATRAT